MVPDDACFPTVIPFQICTDIRLSDVFGIKSCLLLLQYNAVLINHIILVFLKAQNWKDKFGRTSIGLKFVKK